MKIKYFIITGLFLLLGWSMSYAAPVNTFDYISHKSQMVNIYWEEAQKSYLKGNMNVAANDCAKILNLNPKHKNALAMLKEINPQHPYFKSRRELLEEYRYLVEHLQKQNQLLAAKMATQSVQTNMDLEEQLNQVNESKAQMQNIKTQYEALSKYSRLYRIDANKIQEEDLALKEKIENDFIEKEKLCSAVEKYMYTEKSRLDYLDDLVLKQQIEMENLRNSSGNPL